MRRPKPRKADQQIPPLPPGVVGIAPLNDITTPSYLAQCEVVIARFGWMVQGVFDRQDAALGYCYTVGLLRNYRHPELLIAGIDPSLAQHLLNTAATGVKNGTALAVGAMLPGIIQGFDMLVDEMDAALHGPCVPVARLLEAGQPWPIRVFQLLYPDKHGVYPTDTKCVEKIKIMQEMYPERGGV